MYCFVGMRIVITYLYYLNAGIDVVCALRACGRRAGNRVVSLVEFEEHIEVERKFQ